MANLQANISQNLKREVSVLIKLGVFKDESEVIQVALKKMLAEQSREYLRDLTKREKITEREMLKEWEKIRS